MMDLWLPANVVKGIVTVSNFETRYDTNHLLRYPVDSAGSNMNIDYADLRADMIVKDVIARIRKIEIDKEMINICYIVDNCTV